MINPRSKVKVPPSNSRGDILIETSLDWGWPSEEFSLVGRIQLCCRPPWLPPPSRQTPPPWWLSSIKWKQPAVPTFAGGWSRPCAPSPPRSRWTRRPASRSPAAGRPPPPRSWSRIQDHPGSSGPPRSVDQARKMLLRGESVTSQDGKNGQDGNEGVCVHSQSQLSQVVGLPLCDLCTNPGLHISVGTWRPPGEQSYPILQTPLPAKLWKPINATRTAFLPCSRLLTKLGNYDQNLFHRRKI